LKSSEMSNGGASLVFRGPGVILKKLLDVHVPDPSQFNAIYTFEPYIAMAIECFKRFKLHGAFSSRRLASSVAEVAMLVNHFNMCVSEIRKEAASKRFQSKLNCYRRSSNKNFKELMGYVDALFERYSRLLVLRVDISYKKQFSRITQAEVKRDRERLFENARSNKIFRDMVGYIWKLEHGPEKGFHYHVMFFFDGSKVREDGTLAERIGRYWMNVVTRGRGLYYNCNASKWRYRNCGVGMVSYSDNVMREWGLREAVFYLTKTDLYMKLQTLGRGMGRANQPGSKDSRGRPRAKSTVRV
jgi:hypothetical protein